MSSDVSDDDNNDYTKTKKLSKHNIFQKIADVGDSSRNVVTRNTGKSAFNI